MSHFFSNWSSAGRYQTDSILPGDPNPNNFSVESVAFVGNYILAKIKYPDCTNFEGTKIIVWKDLTEKEFNDMMEIDPHFLENNKVFARFRPTEWDTVVSIIGSLP